MTTPTRIRIEGEMSELEMIMRMMTEHENIAKIIQGVADGGWEYWVEGSEECYYCTKVSFTDHDEDCTYKLAKEVREKLVNGY